MHVVLPDIAFQRICICACAHKPLVSEAATVCPYRSSFLAAIRPLYGTSRIGLLRIPSTQFFGFYLICCFLSACRSLFCRRTPQFVQRWFSLRLGKSSKDAYFLYAASNVGSMCALLAYPTLVEPFLRLSEQYTLFQFLYLTFVVVMVAIIARSWQSLNSQRVLSGTKGDFESESVGGVAVLEPATSLSGTANAVSDSIASNSVVAAPEFGSSKSISDAAPAKVLENQSLESVRREVERACSLDSSLLIPSSLLLSVTTYVTSNIAPMPVVLDSSTRSLSAHFHHRFLLSPIYQSQTIASSACVVARRTLCCVLLDTCRV